MKISIIIPAHNEAEYISKTLAAVTALDYPDFEVIVVDNASTDDTAEVVRKFSNSKIKIITEKQKGVQFAREAGRRTATGDVIAFIDADCLPPASWLKRVASDLLGTAVAVSGPYYYYDQGWWLGTTALLFQRTLYPLTHWILQRLHRGGVMIFGNCAVKKEALEAIGGINTNIIFYGDDTDLAKHLTAVGKIVYDSQLVMNTSGRRLRKVGVLKTTAIYWWYFVKTLVN